MDPGQNQSEMADSIWKVRPAKLPMPDPKGDKLYVNLSAAQTRRRLKGFGHGVRKIHSAGKNQAVIIHTATDRHLEELKAKFDDVGYSTRETDLSEPIENLRNIGVTSAEWLRAAGIKTVADLGDIGPVKAYQMVKRREIHCGLNLLWALAAGLEGQDWRELSEEEKEKLKAEVKDS